METLTKYESASRRIECAPNTWSHIDGSADSWQKMQEFLKIQAEAEIQAFFSPPTSNFVRVMVIRHGMADHNSYGGIGSLVNQDAALNECGRSQASLVGSSLRAFGVVSALDLVVVSPFTRTMETAFLLLGEDLGAPLDVTCMDGSPSPTNEPLVPSFLQPLAAERTQLLSHLGRGDRGSSAEQLSRDCPNLSNVFDFESLKAYCIQKRVNAKDALSEGKWWHHGPHSEETPDSFRRRCAELRRWIGSLRYKRLDSTLPSRVLLVSHGGVMQQAFGYTPNAPNCGFRVFDVAKSGASLCVATGERVNADFWDKPVFQVLSVIRRVEDGHNLYSIELQVGCHSFVQSARESELRVGIHDVVKETLTTEEYKRFRLDNKFPDVVRLSTKDASIYIQDYLQQLAVVMSDVAFPTHLAHIIDMCLLGGLVNKLAEGQVD